MNYEQFKATRRITRRPVEGRMVYDGAQALWEHHREEEGRITWEEAEFWQLEPLIRQVTLCLEAALCMDDDFPLGNRATDMAFNDHGGGSMTYRTMSVRREND